MAMTQSPLPLVGSPRQKVTLNDRLAEYFKARPNQDIDARDLLPIAGFAGWRSRVAELRFPPYSMVIENKWKTVDTPNGRRRVSWYRYVPAQEQAA